MGLISNFYKNKFERQSHIKIKNYIKVYANIEVVLFTDKTSYKELENLLNLKSLKNISIKYIEDIDYSRDAVTYTVPILILVKNFFYEAKAYAYLMKYYDGKMTNIYKDLFFGIGFVNRLESNKLFSNIDKLERQLSTSQCQEIIQKEHDCYVALFKDLLEMSKLVNMNSLMAFYFSNSYFDTFGNLINKLDDIIVFCDDELSTSLNFFYGEKYIEQFDFIKIFVGTYVKKLPERSKFINFNHGVIDDPEVSVNFNEFVVYVKEESSVADINIISSTLLNLPNSICLGYPKLDKFIDFYQKNKQEKNCIMLATSHIVWNFQKLSPIVQDKSFTNRLLTAFPKEELIFRPHPGATKHKYIINYVSELLHFENFSFDTEKSYLQKFSQAKVFISDGLSSSAYTYAFATLNPVIFYIPKLDEYIKDYGDTSYVKNLEIIGDVVSTQNKLISIVHRYLKDSRYLKKKVNEIRVFRDKNIANISHSENMIINFFNNYRTLTQANKIKTFYEEVFHKKSKKNITKYFNQFIGKGIAIYGAGEHYQSVLKKLYDFGKLNIKYFSDSDQSLIGKDIEGIEIVQKEKLLEVDAILISSKKFELEIKEILEYDFNNVYTVYEALNYNLIFAESVSYNELDNNSVWLNIQIIESRLSSDDIKQIIDMQYQSYEELLQGCCTYVNKDGNTKIEYTNDLQKLYLKDDAIYLKGSSHY